MITSRPLRLLAQTSLRQPFCLLLLTFVLLCLTLLLAPHTHVPVGDTNVYAAYAQPITHGAWPYREQPLEYPPGVLPFLLLPVWIASLTGLTYPFAFALVAGACLWLLLWDIGKVWDGRTVFVAALFALVFGRFIFFQLDIFAAVALYGALRTLKTGHAAWSAVLFAAAVLIKGYPLVCLPAFLCFLPTHKRWRFAAATAGTVLAALLPFLLTAPDGLWHSVTYHTGRPPEIMSLPAAIGFVLHFFGEPARVALSHASLTLIFPHAKLMGALSDGILAAGWVVVAVALWRQGMSGRAGSNCLLLLLLFIIFFKVGSPQFLLAALCSLPFVAGELRGQPLRWPIQICLGACIAAVLLLDFATSVNRVTPAAALLTIARLVGEGWLLVWIFRRSDAYSYGVRCLHNLGARFFPSRGQ